MEIIDTLNKITICFAFIIMILTIIGWGSSFYQYRKMKQEISIVIIKNGIPKTLPITLLRKNFTRAELMGVLGIYDKNHKFDIYHTTQKEFFDDIHAIQLGKKDKIFIRISENDKFDFHFPQA
ncbi:MAG: hypothetical protein J6U05_07035 [Neisseriaceae bacterium]|nr:hypothetical protein [Neisseriaceae bacterium]MBO7554809.1 hypothetical protein [Neisseriaceae bacterium]